MPVNRINKIFLNIFYICFRGITMDVNTAKVFKGRKKREGKEGDWRINYRLLSRDGRD
jgi:hypothetical protein